MRPSTLSLPIGLSKLLHRTFRSRLPVLMIGLGSIAGATTALTCWGSSPGNGSTARAQPGFDFTETIRIDESAATVWATLVDIETWWLPSNPEHDSIERLDPGHDMAVGTRFRIREKIAGVPGTGIGAITHLDPGTSVTWESDQMRYQLLAVPFTISEGVTWRVDADSADHCRVSAHVWARFPTGPGGKLLWLLFTRLLNGINKDRRHARTELEYLNAILGR